MTEADHQLDVRGHLCPFPVLKARKRLHSLPPGAVLEVIATDPATVIDVPHFCNEQGHALLSQTARDGLYIFRIRRK